MSHRASDSPGAQQYVCDAWSRSSSLAEIPRIGADPPTARKASFYRHKWRWMAICTDRMKSDGFKPARDSDGAITESYARTHHVERMSERRREPLGATT